MARVNVFAGAIAAAARDAGKVTREFLDETRMPDFDREYAGQATDFDFQAIPDIVALLPNHATWHDIRMALEEQIRGYVLLHPEHAIGPTITPSGQFHCPPGIEPDDVAWCC